MNTRTNIVLDDELVAQAMVRARVTTKKAAVEAALKAYVRKPDYSGLLALRGSGVLADDYDPDECYKQYPIEPLIASEPAAPELFKPASAKARMPGGSSEKVFKEASRKAPKKMAPKP